MKVALITPYYRQQTRGNAVTVSRIERHFFNEGCSTRLFSLDEMQPEDILAGIREYSPDLVHAFHALYGGKVALDSSELLGIPYIVTLTGTDIYGGVDLDRGLMTKVLSRASLITSFHGDIRQKLAAFSPLLIDKCRVVPQGVILAHGASSVEPGGAEFKFLLPGGIRGVKNPLFALRPLDVLYKKHPYIRLQLAGPTVEAACCEALVEAIDHYPFVKWLGEVPPCNMTGLYLDSSVVLNTSLSEGGMANSLLEAMACGRAVLAADIEGNRTLVKDGENGLLYQGEADFIAKATELVMNSALRKRLGEAGREYVRANCSPVTEARRYLELYPLLL